MAMKMASGLIGTTMVKRNQKAIMFIMIIIMMAIMIIQMAITKITSGLIGTTMVKRNQKVITKAAGKMAMII